MLKKITLMVVTTVIIAIVIYRIIPKYDLYVSGGSGTAIYRFNKITGGFESLQSNGEHWSSGLVGYVDGEGIRHPGTWKEK